MDALRSDDSQKKDIIKNIALLKPDLERLNNGFDSIVISLNDNFKTIIKTITTIDKTEYLDKFADSLNSIEMSRVTPISAYINELNFININDVHPVAYKSCVTPN